MPQIIFDGHGFRIVHDQPDDCLIMVKDERRNVWRWEHDHSEHVLLQETFGFVEAKPLQEVSDFVDSLQKENSHEISNG